MTGWWTLDLDPDDRRDRDIQEHLDLIDEEIESRARACERAGLPSFGEPLSSSYRAVW